MITHIVMYRLKNKEDAPKLTNAFLSMCGKIDCLYDLQAGEDFLGEQRSYDVALIARFRTKEDLHTYTSHPVHLPVIALVKELAIKSHSVDFES